LVELAARTTRSTSSARLGDADDQEERNARFQEEIGIAAKVQAKQDDDERQAA